jgi:hypothetical protein
MTDYKEMFGINHKNGTTSCISCGVPINERMQRSQGGRCDDCWGLLIETAEMRTKNSFNS